MKKLTQKQENFTLNLFKGMTQREAYTNAGYSSGYAIEVLDTNASVLANSNKILLRLKELRGQTEDDTVLTVLQRKQRLTEITKKDIKAPVTAKESILAIGELNKMDHIYTEPVTENKVIVQTSIFILPDGQRLTAKQLKEGVENEATVTE